MSETNGAHLPGPGVRHWSHSLRPLHFPVMPHPQWGWGMTGRK